MNKMSKQLRNKNIFKLEINDLFIELKEENNRLLNELQFALKFINLLENQRNYFIKRLNCCPNCGQNRKIKQKIEYFLEEKNSLFNNKCIQKSDKIIKFIKQELNSNEFNCNRFENKIKKSAKTFENNLLKRKRNENEKKFDEKTKSLCQTFSNGIHFY